jgi:hypothetical protein
MPMASRVREAGSGTSGSELMVMVRLSKSGKERVKGPFSVTTLSIGPSGTGTGPKPGPLSLSEAKSALMNAVPFPSLVMASFK